jgi:putative ABC transport system permease protein
MDGSVLAFTLAASIGTGILFGTGPALALWRTSLSDALKEGGRTSAGAAGLRLRGSLVAAELAVAIMLLIGAGLMLKSFLRMHAHPPGFSPENILTIEIRLAGPHYREEPAQQAYVRELLRRVESAPGVEAAGVSLWFLFEGVPFPSDISPGQTHVIRLNATSPRYLRALGIRLLRGRWLGDTDSGAVLLNESMARQAFGALDPIGRRISAPGPATVVGVVTNLKYSQLDAAPPAEIYIPYQQSPFFAGGSLAVRTAGDALAMAPAIRKLILGIDPTQPVYSVKTLEQALADSVAPRRFNARDRCTDGAGRAASRSGADGRRGGHGDGVGRHSRRAGWRLGTDTSDRQPALRCESQRSADVCRGGCGVGRHRQAGLLCPSAEGGARGSDGGTAIRVNQFAAILM